MALESVSWSLRLFHTSAVALMPGIYKFLWKSHGASIQKITEEINAPWNRNQELERMMEPSASSSTAVRRTKKEGTRNGWSSDEPTCRCHQNPFIGALGIQQPVILGEPQIDQWIPKTGSRKQLPSSLFSRFTFLFFVNCCNSCESRIKKWEVKDSGSVRSIVRSFISQLLLAFLSTDPQLYKEIALDLWNKESKM